MGQIIATLKDGTEIIDHYYGSPTIDTKRCFSKRFGNNTEFINFVEPKGGVEELKIDRSEGYADEGHVDMVRLELETSLFPTLKKLDITKGPRSLVYLVIKNVPSLKEIHLGQDRIRKLVTSPEFFYYGSVHYKTEVSPIQDYEVFH